MELDTIRHLTLMVEHLFNGHVTRARLLALDIEEYISAGGGMPYGDSLTWSDRDRLSLEVYYKLIE